MGARAGRGAGYCAGYGMPGSANPGLGVGGGFGFGRGRGAWGRGFGGRGRGWRYGFFVTGMPGWMRPGGLAGPYGYTPAGALDPETEKRMLEGRAEALRSELELLEKRLSEIGAERPTEG